MQISSVFFTPNLCIFKTRALDQISSNKLRLTVWESREGIEVDKQVVLQLQPDEVVEGDEGFRLD